MMSEHTFSVRPLAMKGHSLIEWDVHNGTPGRSLQVETEIAELWAEAPELLDSLKALTASEYAGHNGACVCCRRTSLRGHADDCAFVAAMKLIDSLTREGA